MKPPRKKIKFTDKIKEIGIGRYLKIIVKRYWITPIVLLIYFILSLLMDLTLNAISFRILSTFCSIIIGFGINSYFNIIKIDTKDVIAKEIVEDNQKFMLKLIKRCVFIAFGILFLSILAVSSSESFPIIIDYFIILAIAYIFNLVYVFIGFFAPTYSYTEEKYGEVD